MVLAFEGVHVPRFLRGARQRSWDPGAGDGEEDTVMSGSHFRVELQVVR